MEDKTRQDMTSFVVQRNHIWHHPRRCFRLRSVKKEVQYACLDRQLAL